MPFTDDTDRTGQILSSLQPKNTGLRPTITASHIFQGFLVCNARNLSLKQLEQLLV